MAQKFLVLSLKDAKADTFSPPFFQVNRASALRVLSDLVADERSTVSRHPEDFALFELGTFDDVTGMITSYDMPRHLSNALEWRKDPNEARVTVPDFRVGANQG